MEEDDNEDDPVKAKKPTKAKSLEKKGKRRRIGKIRSQRNFYIAFLALLRTYLI